MPLSQAIQALHLYGAATVCALGWAVGNLAGFDPGRFVPLWLAGMLAIYNIDRIKEDPADAFNVPRRHARRETLLPWSLLLIVLSSGVLIIHPLWLGDLRLLGLVAGAALVSIAYSVPVYGRRLKDIPFLKTFFPPAIVAAAYLVPPGAEGSLPMTASTLAVGLWVSCLLFSNMLLCDLRDVDGDRAARVISLPVAIGPRRTSQTLNALAVVAGMIALALSITNLAHRWTWLALAVIVPVYIAALCRAVRQPRSEAFYEWWVEGLFLAPPVICAAVALVGP